MLVEFLVAVASGIVVALFSTFFQSQGNKTEAFFEVKRRSEWTLRRATFQNGRIVQEDTEVRVEEKQRFGCPSGRG